MAKISEIFLDNLKQLRESRNWTQAQTAEKAGMPLPTYRDIEYGVNFPRAEQIAKLAKAFGIEESVLFSVAIQRAGYLSKIPADILEGLEQCENPLELEVIRAVLRGFAAGKKDKDPGTQQKPGQPLDKKHRR